MRLITAAYNPQKYTIGAYKSQKNANSGVD
jgi:hypothetical protein